MFAFHEIRPSLPPVTCVRPGTEECGQALQRADIVTLSDCWPAAWTHPAADIMVPG